MARPDGRIEKGQPLASAISARAWNRTQDAADIVLGVGTGSTVPASAGRLHALGKTASEWTKGTAQNITLWAGTLGSEQQTSDVVPAWNKFATIAADRWVMLGRIGDSWYLIAAEC